MNNTVLKIIAGLLALGAVIVAIVGIRLSQQPATVKPAEAPASVPTESVVVAARAIKAGQMLGPADLVIKGVTAPPAQAFRQTQDALGKVVNQDVVLGTPIEPKQLASENLASHLLPGERAVAVFIDEVVGLGGFGKPGDHVDVMGYVGAKTETNDNSFAEIVVHDARVLSFGDVTQMDADRERQANPITNAAAAETGVKDLKEIKERRMNMRSAVLAVPVAEATHLMLAANAGQLRLALRPQATTQADPLGMYPASFNDGTGRAQIERARRTVTLSDVAPGGRKPVPPPAPEPIIIQEGSKERPLAKLELK
jgi:pilus assembly protein CpaB